MLEKNDTERSELDNVEALPDALCSLTLAERIAKRILTYDDKGSVGYRISIKSGTWTQDHSQEIDQGGLCHAALITIIQDELNSANSKLDE